MDFNKKWFSLIEVVIATSIITITVFWVYKLIWENSKIISNSSNYLQVNSLIPVLQECLEDIGFNNLYSSVWEEYTIGLWNSWFLNECNKNSTDSIIIDNIEYNMSVEIIDISTDEYIEWELAISSENTKTMTWYYKQIYKE